MKIKTIIAIGLSVCIGSAHAGITVKESVIDVEKVELLVDQEIGAENTCIDEFVSREKYLKKFLLWAPPLGVLATPVAGYAGGLAAAGISSAAGVGGWSALGWTVGGVFAAGGAALGTFVFLEVSKGIEFSNNRYMIRLVSAAHLGDMENDKIQNFIKRYRNKYEQDTHLSDTEIVQELADLDESQALCDGTVTGNTGKFKKMLSRRRHALRYIHDTLGRP